MDVDDPTQYPFFKVMLVMMRLKFTKKNDGSAELKLTTKDLDGSIFMKVGG